jgi:lipopolysaccharide/colanic/teichoic acid biosynthesis glycosyltransferase
MLLQTQGKDAPIGGGLGPRTIWGLDALGVHDQFWAAHGLQVIRPGEQTPISPNAIGYLLLNRQKMVIFSPVELRSQWTRPDVLYLRLFEPSRLRERVVTDESLRFVRFERTYRGSAGRESHSVLLTPDARIAAMWQVSANTGNASRKLKQVLPRNHRFAVSMPGRVYDFRDDVSHIAVLHELMRTWGNPNAAVQRVSSPQPSVFCDSTGQVRKGVRFVGPAWIGAGRSVDGAAMVIGPVVLWDDPAARPAPQAIVVDPLAGATDTGSPPPTRQCRPIYQAIKRAVDIAFAVGALLITLPVYPLIMSAIWLESGRPFFFAHRRETLHGRRFGCIKFRSMRRDAEKMKLNLAGQNQADGPQFFMEEDPRLTRVGKLLREFHLDELPQFINVLLGHMSLVGPRPSPFKENQFCPQWRAARLSVRPGITGLWQVMRTREKDKDFQEWIRYDIEYVERAGPVLDASILLRTVLQIVGRALSRTRRSPEVTETTSVVETSC